MLKQTKYQKKCEIILTDYRAKDLCCGASRKGENPQTRNAPVKMDFTGVPEFFFRTLDDYRTEAVAMVCCAGGNELEKVCDCVCGIID